MRSRDPVILKGVKRSIIESLLVFALLLCIVAITVEAQTQFAKTLYRFVDIEARWQLHCEDTDPKDWGQYCHWLELRLKQYPVTFIVKSFLSVLITAILLSNVCAELLLEIHTRSLRFQEWYWDEYSLQWKRVMAHGG